MINKQKLISIFSILSGIILALTGTWGIGVYFYSGIAVLEQPDKSIIFWSLPILFIGVITVQNPTSVNDDKITVEDFELKQNYPNSFNPSTNISFVIPTSGLVNLKVFNILGNEITTLLSEQLLAGEHTVPFNAAGLSSGIYFYSLTVNNFTKTKEMVLLK